MKLDHEKLEVYGLATELRRVVIGLTAGLPRGHAGVRDQLNRASLSVKLTIAEGSGEYAPQEKARFYRMARRSAIECGAVLDDLEDLGLVTAAETAAAHQLVFRIVSALVRLIQSTERTPLTPTRTRKPAHAPTRTRAPTPTRPSI